MQCSYRWYVLGTLEGSLSSASIRAALRGLSKGDCRFADGHADGEDSEFVFLRKAEVSLEQRDAKGRRTYTKATVVTSCGVDIVRGSKGAAVRVSNPGRNMRPLLDTVERAFGFGFWAKPVVFDLAPIINALSFDVKRIVVAKINNVVVAKDCIGRMEFASRSGLELESLKFLGGMSYRRDLVKMEVGQLGERGVITLTASGVARIGGGLAAQILTQIEKLVLSSD